MHGVGAISFFSYPAFLRLLHTAIVHIALLNQFLDGQNPLKARRAFEPRGICPLHLKSFLYIRDGASRPALRALTLSFHTRILNLLDNNCRVRGSILRFSKLVVIAVRISWANFSRQNIYFCRFECKISLDTALVYFAIICSVMQNFSTRRAAKLIGVHVVTLRRWLATGKIRPSIKLPFDGRTLWRFTLGDVKRFRKFKNAQKRGPKPKKRRK